MNHPRGSRRQSCKRVDDGMHLLVVEQNLGVATVLADRQLIMMLVGTRLK